LGTGGLSITFGFLGVSQFLFFGNKGFLGIIPGFLGINIDFGKSGRLDLVN